MILTPQMDAGGMHTADLLKIQISGRNRNQNHFTLFIRGHMGSNHEKSGDRKSRETLPLTRTGLGGLGTHFLLGDSNQQYDS